MTTDSRAEESGVPSHIPERPFWLSSHIRGCSNASLSGGAGRFDHVMIDPKNVFVLMGE